MSFAGQYCVFTVQLQSNYEIHGKEEHNYLICMPVEEEEGFHCCCRQRNCISLTCYNRCNYSQLIHTFGLNSPNLYTPSRYTHYVDHYFLLGRSTLATSLIPIYEPFDMDQMRGCHMLLSSSHICLGCLFIIRWTKFWMHSSVRLHLAAQFTCFKSLEVRSITIFVCCSKCWEGRLKKEGKEKI